MRLFGYEIKKADPRVSKKDEKEIFQEWLPRAFKLDTVQQMIEAAHENRQYIGYRKLVFPDLTKVTCPFEASGLKKQLDSLISHFRRDKWFSICEVREILDKLGLECADQEAYKKLGAIHCVHWDKMHPDVVPQVVTLINKVFGTHVEPPPPEGLVVKE